MPQPASEELSFERILEKIEAIVLRLEDGQIGLSESLSQYEQAVQYLKHCYQALEAAERKIELLAGVDADGNPITRPFDAEATDAEKPTNRRPRTTRRSSSDEIEDTL